LERQARYDKSLAEGNFYDEHRKAQKPVVIEDYSLCMSYIDKKDRICDAHSISP
jgi:hypothetical protein